MVLTKSVRGVREDPSKTQLDYATFVLLMVQMYSLMWGEMIHVHVEVGQSSKNAMERSNKEIFLNYLLHI
jgi:hypothetical protein